MKEVKIECITSANNLFSLQCSENTHTEFFRFNLWGKGAKSVFTCQPISAVSQNYSLFVFSDRAEALDLVMKNGTQCIAAHCGLSYLQANIHLQIVISIFCIILDLNLRHAFCRYIKHRISVILTVRYYHQQQLLNFRQNYI